MKTFPYDFSLSHGVWHPHQNDYIAYSDGEPTESYLSKLFSTLQPLASDSPDFLQYIKDWPSQYHLSPVRANLLRALPLAPELSVLELGSGCGAITRYLGETCRKVFAVEGSSFRAQLTRKRCRDLANVAVIATNFDDLSFREPFDVITLIGVLEYASVYGRGPLDPFVALLRLACQNLQENGVLILAIENQLGIKYLAGANEDHLGRPYLGVQGYLDDHTPKTFGRMELLHLLNEAGFSECQLLLPFPDYKLPVTFINSKFTSAPEVQDYNLMEWCRQPSQDYTSSRPFLFNEHLALATAAQNGLLADHANSFLVLAYKRSMATAVIPQLDWICRKINISRNRGWQTITTLAFSGGQVILKKEGCRNAPSAPERPVRHVLGDATGYIQKATSLSSLMIRALHRSSLAQEHFISLLKRWLDFLRHHEIREEKLPSDYFDCIPDNLVADEHNVLHFIDREWHWEGPLPRLWVLVRGLRAFWAAYQPWLERLAWPGSRDSLQFLDECLAHLEIPATAADIKNCLEQEDLFQQLVIWGKEGTPPPPSTGSFVEDLLQEAREALNQQDWQAAAGFLEELTSRFPELLEAYLLLSDTLTMQGKHREAFEVLRRARQINADALPLLKRLGLNSRQRGDLSSALAALTRAWDQTPQDPEILAHLSATCLDLGLHDEAKHYYRQALNASPQNIELWLGLAGVARRVGDRKTLEEAIQRAAALNPAHPRLQELTSGRVQAGDGAASALPIQAGSGPGSGAERIPASIIIPVFNNLELTQNCLESIWEHTPPDLYEIILVDNGSSDGTPAFLKHMATAGKICLIANETNLGYSKACNQGARSARGDYLVMLNNDTVVTKGWLEALIEPVEKDDNLAIVGAKLLYPDDSVQHAGVVFNQNGRVYHLYRYFHRDHPAVNKNREFQVVTAACLLVRTSIFFQVGLFDENFRNGFEDVDLCLKVKQLGHRLLYNPECVVYHLESKTAGRHDHELNNARYLSEKWHGRIVPDDLRYYEEDGLRMEWITSSDGGREAVIHDQNDNPYKQEARTCLNQGDLSGAMAFYNLALRFNPFDPRNRALIAEIEALKDMAEPRSQAVHA